MPSLIRRNFSCLICFFFGCLPLAHSRERVAPRLEAHFKQIGEVGSYKIYSQQSLLPTANTLPAQWSEVEAEESRHGPQNLVRLSWESDPGFPLYLVQICQKNKCSPRDIKSFLSPTNQLRTLTNGKVTFYWRVLGVSEAGEISAPSKISFFAAEGPPKITEEKAKSQETEIVPMAEPDEPAAPPPAPEPAPEPEPEAPAPAEETSESETTDHEPPNLLHSARLGFGLNHDGFSQNATGELAAEFSGINLPVIAGGLALSLSKRASLEIEAEFFEISPELGNAANLASLRTLNASSRVGYALSSAVLARLELVGGISRQGTILFSAMDTGFPRAKVLDRWHADAGVAYSLTEEDWRFRALGIFSLPLTSATGDDRLVMRGGQTLSFYVSGEKFFSEKLFGGVKIGYSEVSYGFTRAASTTEGKGANGRFSALLYAGHDF